MKNLVAPALLIVACLVAVPGCPTTTAKKPVEEKVPPKNDPRRVGLELIRQAPDAARYWEGLQLLSADIQQNAAMQERLKLKAKTQEFLQKEAGLDAAELQEVDTPTYRRADSHYLAQCFLLRDAVRSLEISGMPPEELAQQALAWVDRHVLLHEQGDDWLPPAQVLERGFGSLSDRARVFLAMLRQIPMEGCAIVLPEAPDDIVLIGGFTAAARDKLYLFDPRHGSALRMPDGKVATIADVRQNPKLLAAAGLDAKEFAAAQVKLAYPLNALPPRMQELQQSLLALERVTLYLDAVAVERDFARLSALPVRVWNTPTTGAQAANSPTRALRSFLPPEEGGIDKTGRRERFHHDLVPWGSALHALDQINLGPEQMPKLAHSFLLNLIGELFKRYDLQPREMLLHGKGEDAIRRLARAQLFFDDEQLDGLSAGDPGFMKAVAKWREHLAAAFARLGNGDAEGRAAVNSFWAEDQFLLTLLHTEGEDRLNAAAGPERQKPPEKTTTTSIVAFAARDHLKQQALLLRAMVWQDKAEREQARAEREQDKTKRAQRQKALRDTWTNTRVAWNQIKDGAAVSPTGRQQRLAEIRPLLKRNDARSATEAAQLLAALHLELHQHYAANIQYARAVYHLDGAKPAQTLLRSLDADLAALLQKDKSGQIGLQGDVDEAVAQLRGMPVHPGLAHSIGLLASDWAPRGNYYWIRQRIARQLAQWEKS